MNELQSPCKKFDCYSYAWKKGYCKKHYDPGFNNNARANSLPKNWSSMRNFILARDKWICYICGEKGADSVDHIQEGDNHDHSNLAACHQNVEPYCHRKKTSKMANLRKGVLTKNTVIKKEPEIIKWNI